MDTILDEIATIQEQVQPLNTRIVHLQGIVDKLEKCDGDIEKAICLLKSKYMDLDQVMEHFDGCLASQMEFWSAFLEAKNEILRFHIPSHVTKCFQSFPAAGTQDWKIFIDLGKYDPWLFYNTLTNGGLTNGQMEGIVPVFAKCSPLYFLVCTGKCSDTYDVYGNFPQLVASILKRLPLYDMAVENLLTTHILPTTKAFWANRELALAWAHGGGGFLKPNFPQDFQKDTEILLAFAGNTGRRDRLVELDDSVRANKDVMLKLIRSNSDYLEQIADELVGDMDLLFVALSDVRAWFYDKGKKRWKRNGERGPDFWIRVTNAVRKRLNQYNVFVNGFLPLMTFPTQDILPLLMLNQGEETLQKYKKKIAEYLGIPLGEELRTLRAASKTLSVAGFYTWEDKIDTPRRTRKRKRFDY